MDPSSISKYAPRGAQRFHAFLFWYFLKSAHHKDLHPILKKNFSFEQVLLCKKSITNQSSKMQVLQNLLQKFLVHKEIIFLHRLSHIASLNFLEQKQL
jgi:hypothetical protein